jgi:hypothetical protein
MGMGNALRAQMNETAAALEANLLDDFVLARIAPESGATRGDILRDLTPFLSHRLSPSEIREEIDGSLKSAEARDHAFSSRGRFHLSPAGQMLALELLGGRTLPKDWQAIRDVHLPARALGLEKESPQRIKTLARPDGLRAAVLQRAYGLKGKRAPSPARLRSILAGIALERAFGNKIKGDIAAGEGLSAKAGRLLAAQLCSRPREFGTDSRLIAALAAEAAGAVQSDHTALRTAVLRQVITKRMPAQNGTLARPEPTAPEATRKAAAKSRPPAASRPDLAGFAEAVLSVAESKSEGWPGNRKTLIVHAWRNVQERYPEWGLTEIEFKAMLTEAHRTGHIVLANADLKNKDNARDIQDSAISFKNTVWHFIRIDA